MIKMVIYIKSLTKKIAMREGLTMSNEALQKNSINNDYILFFNIKRPKINSEIIEDILSDMNKVSLFIRDYDYFDLDIDVEEAIKIINQYAMIKQFYDKNIDIKFFDNINYINNYYNIKETLDYKKYLSQFNNDITIEDLLNILTNEKEFNKFILNFDRYKEHFKNLEQSTYNDKLKYFIDNAKKIGIELDDKSKERYKIILNNSATTIEKERLGYGMEPSLKVSKEIYEHIIKKVDSSLDDFTIARSIYIELGKIFDFSLEYLSCLAKSYNDLSDEETYGKTVDILGADSSNFDLKNNKVVCHDWANIYGSLLKMFDIDCIICGNYHSHVEFKYNGLVIKADATESFTGRNDNIKIYDLSRIKMDVVTGGFSARNKSKNIKYLIENADKKIQYQPKEIVDKCDEYSDKYMTVECEINSTYESIISELKNIVNICRTYDFEDFEYINLVRAYISSRFDDLDMKHFGTTNLLSLEDASEKMFVIFSLIRNEAFEHYLIGKNFFEKISKEELEKKLSNKTLIKQSINDLIPGISIDEEIISKQVK